MAQAKKKSNSVYLTKWTGDTLEIKVLSELSTETEEVILGRLTFDVNSASAENRKRAEMHGWTQRICDAAALAKDPKTGKSATRTAKLERMQTIIDWYAGTENPWKMTGTGEARSSSEQRLLLAAFMEWKSLEEDRAKKFLATRTKEQLHAIRNIKAVVQIMNRLREEEATEVDGLDIDAELEDFEDGEDAAEDSEAAEDKVVDGEATF